VGNSLQQRSWTRLDRRRVRDRERQASREFKCAAIARAKRRRQRQAKEKRVSARLGDEYLEGLNKTNFDVPAQNQLQSLQHRPR